jgi:hypothetical protein
MKRSTIYGIALLIGSVGMIVTLAFHPTAHDLLSPDGQIARRYEIITMATHSLALVSFPILVFGFHGLSRGLGLDRPPVSAALIAYAFAAVAGMFAAVVSGLIAPVLTGQILGADESTGNLFQLILKYNGLLNQAFAKIVVCASSIAVVLWSGSILRISKFAQVVGLIGFVVGIASIVAFLSGHLRLNVHGFGLFIFAQSVWVILLGVFLWRSGDSLQAA